MPRTTQGLGGSSNMRPSEWALGWPCLLAGFFGMVTGWNVVGVALSVFLIPMQTDLGWSRTDLSISPVATLLSALLLPLTGYLLDRFGSRAIAISGTILMAVALGLFAVVPITHGLIFGLTLILSLAAATINSVVLSRGIAAWFQRNLGTAIGILMTGTSVALAVTVPVLSYVINSYGWRTGFLTFGGIGLFFSLPILLAFFREPDAAKGLVKNNDAILGPDRFATLFSQPRFWILVTACLASSIPVGGAINHLVPLLTDRGLTLVQAGQLGSVFAIAIGVASLVSGILYDRMHPPLVTAAIFALSGLGTALLYAAPIGRDAPGLMVVLAVALIGLATGVQGNCISFFSNWMFGFRNFSRVISLLALTISFGMAFGGLLFATVYDKWGTYQPAVIASIGLYVLSALIFSTMGKKAGKSPSEDLAF